MLAFCGIGAAFGADISSIDTDGIKGVIVSDRGAKGWGVGYRWAEGFWTPTSRDIGAAESHLRAALENGKKDPATIMSGPFSEFSRKHSSEEIAGILEHYKEYKRQYFGVIVRGKRYVYLNSFPARESMHERERFVSVMDGGYWFWRVLFSVEDGTFSQLSVNGSA